MKLEDQPVTAEHTRSPSPECCGYCHVPLGDQHKADCVCRKRTVVVQATITYTILEVESSSEYDIEFHLNDSSWCVDNMLADLEKLSEYRGCLCNSVEFKFLREATAEDELNDGVFVSGEKPDREGSDLEPVEAAPEVIQCHPPTRMVMIEETITEGPYAGLKRRRMVEQQP